jgi:hypothetical protein
VCVDALFTQLCDRAVQRGLIDVCQHYTARPGRRILWRWRNLCRSRRR